MMIPRLLTQRLRVAAHSIWASMGLPYHNYLWHPCIYAYTQTLHDIHFIILHSIPVHYLALPYLTLHYITLHYITVHYTTLHYIAVHCITLHFTALQNTTLHCMHACMHACMHTYIHPCICVSVHMRMGLRTQYGKHSYSYKVCCGAYMCLAMEPLAQRSWGLWISCINSDHGCANQRSVIPPRSPLSTV